jgi:phosphate transport system substrate-binding protein
LSFPQRNTPDTQSAYDARMARTVRFALFVTLVLAACHENAPTEPVTVSTAFPLAEAVAHEFMKANKGTPINVAFSGTGTGFVRFCRGQLDLANASRPITVDEQKVSESANVTFVELPVAYDAISIEVSAKNTWASAITVPELRTLWDATAEKKITRWKQVRADWPDRAIALVGPGAESGTFDYFTDAINGRAGASRRTIQAVRTMRSS